jgi:hypothetical protein
VWRGSKTVIRNIFNSQFSQYSQDTTLLPVRNGEFLASTFLTSLECTEYSISDLTVLDVTHVFDSSWLLGCVLFVDEDLHKVEVTVLHFHGTCTLNILHTVFVTSKESGCKNYVGAYVYID